MPNENKDSTKVVSTKSDYENKEVFQKLLEVAIEDPEIETNLLKVRLSKDEVINILNQQAAEIWESSRQYITLYDELARDLSEMQSIIKPARLDIILRSPLGSSMDGILLEFRSDQPNAALEAYHKLRQDPKIAPWFLALDALDAETKKASQIVDKARRAVDHAVLELGILPRLRKIINNRLNPSYEIVLNVIEAPGLKQLYDPTFTIPTESKKKLDRLLKNMSEGSIGIAGPRGAGKSTLLGSVCGQTSSLKELKGRKVLSLLVSAPVVYQARDFILYLFSSVCTRTLELEGRGTRWPSLAPNEHGPFTHLPKFLRFGKLLSGIVLWSERVIIPISGAVGVVLVLLSLFMAALLSVHSQLTGYIRTFQTEPKQLLMVGILILIMWFFLRLIMEGPLVAYFIRDTRFDDGRRFARSILEERIIWMLRILGTFCGLVGAVLVLLSLFITFVLYGHLQPSEYFKILAVSPGTLLIVGVVLLVVSLVLPKSSWRSALRFLVHDRVHVFDEISRETAHFSRNLSQQLGRNQLVIEAEQWLDRIRFQQSYSSGWSGSIQLPLSFSGGISEAISLAHNQLSLPEIIEGYRKFVMFASESYEIIIGIDELDKIESGEKAQQFLNEIKAIFNLPKCFYLIAVSENAMSSFERRGLPFRDAFDSSFDLVISVNYFNLEQARSFIQERVISMPIPFVDLVYCVSGGLARDLLRTMRTMFDLVNITPETRELSKLSSALLTLDVKAKLHAAAIAARDFKEETELDRFLGLVFGLESQLSAGELSQKHCQQLLHETYTALLTEPGLGVKISGGNIPLSPAVELGTYLYYTSTLLDLFANDPNPTLIEELARTGMLDSLAKARQEMAISTVTARSLITNVRHSSKLPIPRFADDEVKIATREHNDYSRYVEPT